MPTMSLDPKATLERLREARRGKSVPQFEQPDPDREVLKKQVRLEKRLWERLKVIGREQTPKRSMNAVIEFFLEWAIEDYELGKAQRNRKK